MKTHKGPRARGEIKKRPCLRCGEITKTTREVRLCPWCDRDINAVRTGYYTEVKTDKWLDMWKTYK
jgi:hypothetical protein